jgi:glyoxylase-like metal-dependent hydrolase (beta-lactamase superfamily II)
MSARELAPGVVILPVTVRDSINAYLIGDVLLDAGARQSAGRLRKMLSGRKVASHALTHVHPDHQGSTDELCKKLGLELSVPAGEVKEMEAGEIPGGASSVPARFMRAVAAGPGHPVTTGLVPGDEVGGFTVIATPGHSPDHIALFRESDRVLIAGDALRNFNYATGGPKFELPFPGFSIDPDQARRSATELIDLRPSLVAFGHGSPIGGEAFMRGMAKLELA